MQTRSAAKMPTTVTPFAELWIVGNSVCAALQLCADVFPELEKLLQKAASFGSASHPSVKRLSYVLVWVAVAVKRHQD